MKKIVSIMLVLVMVLSLAACGGKTEPATTTAPAGTTPAGTTPAQTGSELAGTYDIKVWVAEAITGLTEQQIADFNATNE